MGIVARAYNTSTEEVEAGRQGFKDLEDEFEASLGYTSPHLKTNNNNRFIVKHKPSLTKANYALLFLLYFYSFCPCKDSYGFNQAQLK